MDDGGGGEDLEDYRRQSNKASMDDQQHTLIRGV